MPNLDELTRQLLEAKGDAAQLGKEFKTAQDALKTLQEAAAQGVPGLEDDIKNLKNEAVELFGKLEDINDLSKDLARQRSAAQATEPEPETPRGGIGSAITGFLGIGGGGPFAGIAAAGPAGAALAVLGAAGNLASKALGSLAGEAAGVVDAFKEVSPAMASIAALREIRDITRGRQVGELIAPSASVFEDEMAGLRDALAPFKVLAGSLSSATMAALVDALTDIIRFLTSEGEPILDAIIDTLATIAKTVIELTNWVTSEDPEEAKKELARIDEVVEVFNKALKEFGKPEAERDRVFVPFMRMLEGLQAGAAEKRRDEHDRKMNF